jgi:hypothetical protein
MMMILPIVDNEENFISMRPVFLLTLGVFIIALPRLSWAGITLGSYDLIVTNNLSTTSEVEGRTIVGGTLSGSSTQYGFMLGSNTNTSLLANKIASSGTVTASTGTSFTAR